jgi:hypothetical protein
MSCNYSETSRVISETLHELQARRREGVLTRVLMQDYQLSKARVCRYLGQ